MPEINKERKYILIGGMILLLLGAVYRFFPDIERLFSGGDDVFLTEKRLAKYREMILEKDQLQAGLVAVNRSLVRAEAGLLTGGTSALAAVDIQNILNDIAGRSQAEIKTMRVLKAKEPEEGDYMAIPVHVTLNATIRQFKEMLYRIESSPRLLKVTNIRVRLPNIRKLDMIQANFTVEGVMKKFETSGS